MRRFLILTVLVSIFASGTAFAEYDVSGLWLLEGSGYAEKSPVRSELTDTGTLDIKTETKDGVQYIVGYSLELRLDASRFNINAWKDSKIVLLDIPVVVPELNPTTNRPFELPPVTIDGLTYEVTFTTTTSGTVKIYGYIDVDVVGSVEINSISVIWKSGTSKPDVPQMTSGCDSGMSWVLLALVLGSGRVCRRFRRGGL
ncbi:MAG: hypothetical protein LBQ42_05560 [Synergistaceae bacterium]|nr:hypothetical protein [Synergistaceae bacterium]